MRKNGNGHADLPHGRDPSECRPALATLLIRLEAKDPATAAHSRAVRAVVARVEAVATAGAVC